MQMPRNILITGASSGLGAALALAYANPATHLFLTGRNLERLNQIAALARQRGATITSKIIDVTDGPAMDQWLTTIDKDTPLDLIIANAGISAGTGSGHESNAQCAAIMSTNIQGVLNTLHPIAPRMAARGRGQIAIMSSLAAFRGLAGAPSYGASKAAVRIYGESLRAELAEQGVAVNVICPGFVQTPMTDVNAFPMPFLMSAERAAQIIKAGLAKNKPRIAFPWQMALLVGIITALPLALTDRLLTRLPRKAGCSS